VSEFVPTAPALAAVALLATGCATVELEDLSTPRPVPAGSCVTIGFLGGLDAWDDPSKGARRLALELRDLESGHYAETLENRRLDVATELVRKALDADRDASLSRVELRRARWIIYGQSLGGGSATLLAWRLHDLGVPVELLLLVDSVSRWDEAIPPNVRTAAALYQDDGWFVRGESTSVPVDAATTALVIEEFDYDRLPGSAISLRGLPWWKLAFRVAHSRMDRDPRVWDRARHLARAACDDAGVVTPGSSPLLRTSVPSPPADGSRPDGSAATSSRSRSRSR
jgi:hypothetical protein